MKKLLALILALIMVMGLLAACGGDTANTTEAPKQTTGASVETTEAPETTQADEKYVVIDKISKHENGWNQNMWGNDAYGVFFNAFANDLPYSEDWDMEYRCVSGDVMKLVRDGETIEIGNDVGYGLVKVSKTEYYLKLEDWILPDGIFPIVNGDMIIVDGDFINDENGWTVHIGPVYMSFAGDMVKFSTTDPNA